MLLLEGVRDVTEVDYLAVVAVVEHVLDDQLDYHHVLLALNILFHSFFLVDNVVLFRSITLFLDCLDFFCKCHAGVGIRQHDCVDRTISKIAKLIIHA